MKMMKIVTVVLTVLCVIYANALPPGRVKRGYNNSGSGYGSERGGGFFERGSDERDASVSREDGSYRRGGECDSDEDNDSREHTYGRDEYGDNDRRYNGRRPRNAD